jgi:hypothetical protein
MASPSTSPYANPVAVQTAVLPPPATQPTQQTAAARRSFKSFVEAMDDFGGDRRDVAGMRQMLAMQAENERLLAARVAAPVASSFAPERAQPEVPVVRGPAQDANLPKPNPGNVLPALPAAPPAAVQTSALPRLPTAAAAPMLVIDPAKINPASGQLGTDHPAAQRIIAYAPLQAPAPPALQTAATAAASSDRDLPQQLRSPLVDEMRLATRSGVRPGLTDDTMARFAAASERKRALAAPMPPRLQAQEARWNRDAWQATVTTARTGTPRGAVPLPTVAAATERPGGLPRLPTATTIE